MKMAMTMTIVIVGILGASKNAYSRSFSTTLRGGHRMRKWWTVFWKKCHLGAGVIC